MDLGRNKKIFTHGNLLTEKIGWFTRIKIYKQPIDNKEVTRTSTQNSNNALTGSDFPARLQL
jgi:hypothetical protein